MFLRTECTIEFEDAGPTPLILMLRPRSGVSQWVVHESYLMEPGVPVMEYTDSYGNLCQRLVAPDGHFRVEVSAEVQTADTIDVAYEAPFVPIPELPDDVLPFLLPSRYCESDQPIIAETAGEITLDAAPGYPQVEAIRAWIHTHVTYQYGSSNPSTSAVQTLAQREGVCRDFTHLGMALCRSMSLPARMVVGYLFQLDPMDLHAWFEAFVGGRWYTFDATQNMPRGGRIAVAYGRDAADVALATQFGPSRLTNLQVQVTEIPQ